MAHLLNFITDNGVLMANDHTALISHTATAILSSLTGVYPDRMGQPVSNSFRYFKTDGTTRTGLSFAYWTAPLFDPAGSTTETTPELINQNGSRSSSTDSQTTELPSATRCSSLPLAKATTLSAMRRLRRAAMV